ncbi:hypothetical protein GCM10011514_04840 [Emticicia aquatilis]|uniref:Uncharacterized protein n=1 Tax=Emticicia aquatilis TaxID=1537369 RepID=A0A917DKF2_9BACT|nr:hypothetical protein [Emticicia aquatilis]GGD43922.1 hypothetical protein GCM10011514_04840 [Emticicia aquatilis]
MKLAYFLTALFLTILFALVFGVVGVVGYYVSYKTDSRAYPWAYSFDENKPLLVGKWSGKFMEPDSMEKKVSLEIYEPYTKLERIFYSIGLPYKRRLYIETDKFDGLLRIENKFRKEEQYKVRGSLNTKNIQLFDFHLLANVKETLPYHYSFLFTEGFWKKNEMSFVITIVFRKSITPNNLKNQEPFLSKKVRVSLNRV